MSSSNAAGSPIGQKNDYNFCLPIKPELLQNERVKLVPFESSYDTCSTEYVNQCIASPQLLKFMPFSAITSKADFDAYYDSVVRNDRSRFWFAIVLKRACSFTRKTRSVDGKDESEETIRFEEETMAGVTGLLNVDIGNSCAEIGFITIFPSFQRTFVATHGNGLLLNYLLNPFPSLHFRRVQWQAISLNVASVNAAKRLGFQLEGIIRWQRVLGEGVTSVESERKNVEGKLPVLDFEGKKLAGGRHSAVLSVCWDDWIDGGKDLVEGLMRR